MDARFADRICAHFRLPPLGEGLDAAGASPRPTVCAQFQSFRRGDHRSPVFALYRRAIHESPLQDGGKSVQRKELQISSAPSVRVGCTRRDASRGVFLRRLNTNDFASETEKHPQPTGDWGSFALCKTPSVGFADTSLTEGGKIGSLRTHAAGASPRPTVCALRSRPYKFVKIPTQPVGGNASTTRFPSHHKPKRGEPHAVRFFSFYFLCLPR